MTDREIDAQRKATPPLVDHSTASESTPNAELAVNVVGHLDDALGVAEAARLYVDTLQAAGVAVSTTSVSPDPDASGADVFTRAGRRPYARVDTASQPNFNLVCLNGEQLEKFMRLGGSRILGGRPSIGQWAWETDVLPASWTDAFRHLDEIWVNSTFVAENLGRLSPVPVLVIAQGLVVPDTAGVEQRLIGDGRFTFLFMMDFFSTLRRKNALGSIDAFQRAFAPGEGPQLLLKTINAPFRRHAEQELRDAIGDRPDIEVVDSYLEPLEKAAVLARADCYVSLHRSEGFGLTLAESMALGTPVIATAYSGNTDFMTDQNSYLVDWSPTRVGPGDQIYPANGTWAEPDLDHASEMMRRVWERPDEAAARAQRAQADIRRLYAPEVTGAIARSRLERLREMDLPARGGLGAGGRLLAEIERELELDVRRGAQPEPRGLAGLVRRFVLRMIAPFTVHERRLDRALFEALRELRVDFERAQRSSSDSTRRRDPRDR